ncbi:glycosyltransferase [candidate division WOR-3 bacterium]|nr:glycosyltransferase [candidate division WOR-3 bacterium]
MTLAIVFTTMTVGGVGRVLCDLANGLVGPGLDVEFVLYKAIGPFLDGLDPRVRVVDLGVLRHPWSLFAFPPLTRYLRRRRPDVVLSAVSGPNVAVLLANRLARSDSKSIITYHSSVGSETISWPLRRLQDRLYRDADRVVAVSGGAADELARSTGLARQDIEVIYNPVDIGRIEALAREPVTDTDWFEPGRPPVIVAAGRYACQKDFEGLVRAFAQVRGRLEARLVILGDGPARPAIEKLTAGLGVAGDVLLAGFTANPYKYFGRAAVFALSSRFEGLPTVVIEALACGCPVVSTDCPHGPREILEDGRWGRLVPVGDPAALAAAITETLAASPRADELKTRAAFFRQDRAVQRYRELIAGLVNG